MKWFSLLAVGLISLGSVAFAQNTPNTVGNCSVKPSTTYDAHMSFFWAPVPGTVMVPFSVGQVIPLSTLTGSVKVFSLSSDGTNLVAKHKARGLYNSVLTLNIIDSQGSTTTTYTAAIQSSNNGKDWTNVTSVSVPVGTSTQNALISVDKYMRVQIVAISPADAALKYPRDTEVLKWDLTPAPIKE
jgi:hypothetical protein